MVYHSGSGAAKAAFVPLNRVPLEAGSDRVVLPEDRDEALAHRVPNGLVYSPVSGLDGIALLRRDVSAPIEEADRDRHAFSDVAGRTITALADLP